MNPDAAPALLQLISSAVTPVVMISACASLILGINNKNSSLADRVRLAVAECRTTELSDSRRQQLVLQIAIFYRRYVLSWAALVMLFSAIIIFVLTVVMIVLTQRNRIHLEGIVLGMFLIGTVFMLAAAAVEVWEIAFANRSLQIEMSDIVPHTDLPRSKFYPKNKVPPSN